MTPNNWHQYKRDGAPLTRPGSVFSSAMVGAGVIGVALIFALLTCGCFHVRQEFVDTDGTKYTFDGYVPPFGYLAKQAGSMAYKWDTKADDSGTGEIAIGLDTEGVDNRGQIVALQSALDSLNKALALAAAKAVIPVP